MDECSMIDLLLMYNLLKALRDSMTLILIGDTDQLPSVGAGNVLCDIIASKAVPVIRLERIFRQAQGSRIIMNAHRINRGEPIDLRGGKDSDFFFIGEEDQDAAVRRMVAYCVKNLPDYYKVDALRDIQLIQNGAGFGQRFRFQGGEGFPHRFIRADFPPHEFPVFFPVSGVKIQGAFRGERLLIAFTGGQILFEQVPEAGHFLGIPAGLHESGGLHAPDGLRFHGIPRGLDPGLPEFPEQRIGIVALLYQSFDLRFLLLLAGTAQFFIFIQQLLQLPA